MSVKILAVSTTAVACNKTPHAARYDAVAVNLSGTACTLQGSDDGTTYNTLASLGTTDMQNVTLPAYVKTAAGTCYILGAP